ncbi:MAG: glucose-1-phosphate cytidylyltransferase [Magnetococcales bacterium]|nr:glucose-1-phosphate cytidylyltransferase [Magnetococcales bacterium]MBF0321893.1 glucose-1-phosphate cytidylyltransferase [Magnetococcales bacterium]
MQVVILCGGYGTRLRQETEFRPKPMVEIGGKPIIWHIMKLFAHYGMKQFILCLGYKSFMIKEYFINYEMMNRDFTITLGNKHHVLLHRSHTEDDYQVTLADTGLESMTGGRIKAVERYLQEDTFMVTYGDGLSDVNLEQLLAFHRSHGKLATVTSVNPLSRFGILKVGDDGQVADFREKPRVDGKISAGFFVFNRAVLDYLDKGPATILEEEPLSRLAQDGQLMAFQHDGFFYAMDTYREYQYLQKLWDSGAPPWKVWSP